MAEEDWLELSKRKEWSDIEPIYLNNENIIMINYSKKFREVFGYIRAIIDKNEISKRGFDLTTEALLLNPANYTVWSYRRFLLKHLNKDLIDELEFVSNVIKEDFKNYQVWFHRLKIVEELDDYSHEFEFINELLQEDSKNYHAWQHRQTILKNFNCLKKNDQGNKFDKISLKNELYLEYNENSSIFLKEIEYTDCLINNDVLNNAAWNHRYFLLNNGTIFDSNIINFEINFIMSKIEISLENESSWNYLKGIYNRANNKEKEAIYNKVNELRRKFSLDILMANVFIIEICLNIQFNDENKHKILEAIKLCDVMFQLDRIHSKYWLNIKSILNSNCS